MSSRVLDLIAEGRNVALVSDAGTPLICDPGFNLVRALWKQKLRVIPVPGPSAITTILSVAPIPNHDFRFVGFIPARARA